MILQTSVNIQIINKSDFDAKSVLVENLANAIKRNSAVTIIRFNLYLYLLITNLLTCLYSLISISHTYSKINTRCFKLFCCRTKIYRWDSFLHTRTKLFYLSGLFNQKRSEILAQHPRNLRECSAISVQLYNDVKCISFRLQIISISMIIKKGSFRLLAIPLCIF